MSMSRPLTASAVERRMPDYDSTGYNEDFLDRVAQEPDLTTANPEDIWIFMEDIEESEDDWIARPNENADEAVEALKHRIAL